MSEFNQESLAQSPGERNEQVKPKKAVKHRVTIANMIRLGDWLRNNYEKIVTARLRIREVAEIATQELGFPIAKTSVVKALEACSLQRWRIKKSVDLSRR